MGLRCAGPDRARGPSLAGMDEKPGAAGHALPISTTFEIPGRQVLESRGTVFGLVVRSVGAVGMVGASFRQLRRGEVPQYTELLEDSRRHAIDRMVENAQVVGADAIVGMRFDSSELGQSLTEIIAYGTAVVLD